MSGVLGAAVSKVAAAAETVVTPFGALSDDLREQQAALDEITHRPWPLPERPWLMGQTWRDLLFAHWRVDPAELRRIVPAELPLDLYDGSGWLAVTPFVVTGLRLAGTAPIPRYSTFLEVNVRTYVSYGGKPGIWFFSLDASSRVAVAGARRTYHLPYFHADMAIMRDAASIAYRSERRHPGANGAARLEASYGPAGAEVGDADELGRWLAERYCLYVVRAGEVWRADIHHRPWPLQPAWGEFGGNTMAAGLGLRLHGVPVLHFSRRQDTVIWPLGRA